LNKILYKRIGIALIRGIQRSKKNPVKWAIERPSTHTPQQLALLIQKRDIISSSTAPSSVQSGHYETQ